MDGRLGYASRSTKLVIAPPMTPTPARSKMGKVSQRRRIPGKSLKRTPIIGGGGEHCPQAPENTQEKFTLQRGELLLGFNVDYIFRAQTGLSKKEKWFGAAVLYFST